MAKKIKRLNATELEVEQILMEKIKDRDNAERYERMIEKIIIHKDEYGLRLEIRMKAPFLEKVLQTKSV